MNINKNFNKWGSPVRIISLAHRSNGTLVPYTIETKDLKSERKEMCTSSRILSLLSLSLGLCALEDDSPSSQIILLLFLFLPPYKANLGVVNDNKLRATLYFNPFSHELSSMSLNSDKQLILL
jgi:hypothetical protein